MKNIKAIIFDAYGTLFDVNSAAEKCKDKIGDKWEPFANFWRTTQLEYTWLRSLMKRHKDFWQITEDSLDKSMKAFDIDPKMKDELLNLYKVLSPFQEVPETLKILKEKNFKLAILSNGTPSLLNQLVKSNNLDNLFTENYETEAGNEYVRGSEMIGFLGNPMGTINRNDGGISNSVWYFSSGWGNGVNNEINNTLDINVQVKYFYFPSTQVNIK